MTVPPVDPSTQALNNAQASLAREQALQAKYDSLVPDLTKVAAGALDSSNDKAGMANALAFAALKHAAEGACQSLHAKTGDMSALRILMTTQPNLITSSSAGIDVASELTQLNERAASRLATKASGQTLQGASPRVGITAIGMAAAALPGVLSLFAKHESLVTTAVAADDLAAIAAVSGVLLAEHTGLVLKSDSFQRAARGALYQTADQLGDKLAELQSLGRDSLTEEDNDLVTLIENTLTAVTSVPKGGTISPLAAASFWDSAFSGPNPFTHVLLVKSETGATTELFDQRQVVSDRVFLAATASITFMLIDAESVIRASGTESATVQMHGKIDAAIHWSVVSPTN
jgi:hypothetical protein